MKRIIAGICTLAAVAFGAVTVSSSAAAAPTHSSACGACWMEF